MRSDHLEIKISLERFHFLFIRTHKKGEAEEVLHRLEQQSIQSGTSIGKLMEDWMKSNYPQPEFREDAWYVREIPLDNCYFAHTDVHCLFPAPKDHTFVEFMRDKREAIDAGTFALSAEIHAPWHEMPEPLVTERGDGRYYVLDGQLRVIRYWYHAVPNVRVFIYRGQLAI